MIRRVFVALSLAGVAVATILVLTRSGTPPGALFALPLTHHATALATTLADVVLRGARFVVLGTVMGVLIPLSASTWRCWAWLRSDTSRPGCSPSRRWSDRPPPWRTPNRSWRGRSSSSTAAP